MNTSNLCHWQTFVFAEATCGIYSGDRWACCGVCLFLQCATPLQRKCAELILMDHYICSVCAGNAQMLIPGSVIIFFGHRRRNVFAEEMCRAYLFQQTVIIFDMFAEAMCSCWSGRASQKNYTTGVYHKEFTSPAVMFAEAMCSGWLDTVSTSPMVIFAKEMCSGWSCGVS
jgi:hypothetical protein